MKTARLLCFLVRSVSSAEAAVFFELKLLWGGSLVLGRCIISLLALCTCKGDYISHYKILYSV
jgi:hypothetical protein